jgi:predicted AlkP superfamily phosphohydrolase/phosphomutase
MFVGYIDPGTGMTIVNTGSFIIAGIFGFLGIFGIYFRKLWGFFGKHKRPVIIIIIVLVISGIILFGMLMNTAAPKFNNKIVILGFDGLSPDIIEPMMMADKLPNFARLKNEGAYRRLRTSNPPQSPVAWTSFATGQNPGKSGLYDFIERDPKNYSLSLSISNLSSGAPKRPIKTKCFWQYSSDRDLPTIIIGCPSTFPPDKVNGKMLSGMGVPDILGTEGTFSFYSSEKSPGEIYSGGNVYHVSRTHLMVANLLGPRVAPLFGKPDNIKVPFKVTLNEKNNSVEIEFQKNKFELKKGEWSKWQDISFAAGPLKTIRGIVKFYLIETSPELKLYASPINIDPRDPMFDISYPKSYSKELAEKIGLYYTQGMPMDTWAVNEKVLSEEPILQEINQVFKERKETLDLELAQMKNGVLFCYFEPSDIIQHMFWRYRDPRHPLHEKDAPEKYRHMIETWYQNMDRVLGEVMDKLGPDDTLIVLSDHGFDSFRRAVHINSWLKENGYLALKNPYADTGAELLADVDWSKTKAYAIGFGAIYLNLEGREKNGIVKKGEEAEKLKTEIADKLSKWIDKKHGDKVVSKVYRKEDIFRWPFVENMPDLYVGFNKGYRASWQTALGAAPEGLIEDNLKKWSGDHLFDPALIPGVLFMNKKTSDNNPSIYDITPTILKTIGFSNDEIKSGDFDGKPLF